MSHLISHFKQSRITLFLALGLVFFTLGSVTLFAAAPNGGYTPGQTLDPDCAPGDTDCIVNPGVGGAVPTNGLQVVGGGIGLGGELTEAVTIIDGEVPGGHSLAFGLVNPFDEFYLGAETININSNSFVVDSAEQVEISGQTASTSGAGEFRIGDINLSSLFGASFPGVATIYSYEHPSTTDIYQMGVFHAEADAFGSIPVSQHFLVNNTTGDSGFLRFVDSGGINVALTVDNGTQTGLSVNETGAGFIINDVNTFNIPTTAGTNGYVLATDGNGNTSWVAGGGGSSLQWYAENASAPGTAPVATGTSSIAIGDKAQALSNNMFVVGDSAGLNATNAFQSNFFGSSAGYLATDAYQSNFFGSGAGYDATNAALSNFFGSGAGYDATSASNANFFGSSAGYLATDAFQSNFLGLQAGYLATNAAYANFFGSSAGYLATDASNANFFGSSAGYDATNANNSNFFGSGAGNSATNANNSNFFGSSAGNSATNANNANFLGQGAGANATNANNANFLGSNAGFGATNAAYANFLGYFAGSGATNAANSLFIGTNAGLNDTVNNTLGGSSILLGNNTSTGGFSNSIAIGANAINTASNQFTVASAYNNWNIGGVNYVLPNAQATTAGQVLTNDGAGVLSWTTPSGGGGSSLQWYAESASAPATAPVATGYGGIAIGNNAQALTNNMFVVGDSAGFGATNAVRSNFLGQGAGYDATNAAYANFLGQSAGYGATDASNANFLGQGAGQNATDAYQSNFLGYSAGYDATNANNANFLGQGAGYDATNAAYANFLGYFAGYGATNAARSIFLGDLAGNNDAVDNTSTNVAENCGGVACYSILMGSQASTGGFSNSIAMGAFAINTASNQFMIGSTARPIEEMRIILDNIGGECVIDITGANCSSDETLKTDITDITNALDIVTQLSGVTYHWVNGEDGVMKTPGFIAQDVKDILPEAVRYNENTGKYMMNYTQIIPYLVEAIKTLNTAVNTGVATGAQVGELVVDRIRARELCLDDLCIDRADLEHILEKTNTSGSTFTPAPTENETIDIVGTDDVAPTDTPTETSNDVSGDTASQGHTDTENPENTDPQAESSDDSQGQSEPATEFVSEEPTTNADQPDTQAASEPVL